jgi:hypothetical protein
MRKSLVCFGVFALLSLLTTAVWAADPQLEKFYPLAAGREWVYTVIVKDEAGKETAKEKLTIVNQAPTELAGKSVTPQLYQRKKSTIFYYHMTDDGIAAIAIKPADQKEPSTFDTPLYMLISPLKGGTSLKKGNFHLTVEADNETLTVPAGTFNNCLKVKTVDAKTGQEILAWFAADVGRLQSIIKRPKGGSSTIQLESFKK